MGQQRGPITAPLPGGQRKVISEGDQQPVFVPQNIPGGLGSLVAAEAARRAALTAPVEEEMIPPIDVTGETLDYGMVPQAEQSIIHKLRAALESRQR